jgi:hypothetical protein
MKPLSKDEKGGKGEKVVDEGLGGALLMRVGEEEARRACMERVVKIRPKNAWRRRYFTRWIGG